MWNTESLRTVLAPAVRGYFTITFSHDRIKSTHFNFHLILSRSIYISEIIIVPKNSLRLPGLNTKFKLIRKLIGICSCTVCETGKYRGSRMLPMACPFIFRETGNDHIRLKFPNDPDYIT